MVCYSFPFHITGSNHLTGNNFRNRIISCIKCIIIFHNYTFQCGTICTFNLTDSIVCSCRNSFYSHWLSSFDCIFLYNLIRFQRELCNITELYTECIVTVQCIRTVCCCFANLYFSGFYFIDKCCFQLCHSCLIIRSYIWSEYNCIFIICLTILILRISSRRISAVSYFYTIILTRLMFFFTTIPNGIAFNILDWWNRIFIYHRISVSHCWHSLSIFIKCPCRIKYRWIHIFRYSNVASSSKLITKCCCLSICQGEHSVTADSVQFWWAIIFR